MLRMVVIRFIWSMFAPRSRAYRIYMAQLMDPIHTVIRGIAYIFMNKGFFRVLNISRPIYITD